MQQSPNLDICIHETSFFLLESYYEQLRIHEHALCSTLTSTRGIKWNKLVKGISRHANCFFSCFFPLEMRHFVQGFEMQAIIPNLLILLNFILKYCFESSTFNCLAKCTYDITFVETVTCIIIKLPYLFFAENIFVLNFYDEPLKHQAKKIRRVSSPWIKKQLCSVNSLCPGKHDNEFIYQCLLWVCLGS